MATTSKRKEAPSTPLHVVSSLSIPSTPRTPFTPSKTEPFTVTSKDIELMNPSAQWIDLKIKPEELRCSNTLTNGQSFTWKAVIDSTAIEALPIESSPSSSSSSSICTPTPKPPNSNLPVASAWGVANATQWCGIINGKILTIQETVESTLVRQLYPENGDEGLLVGEMKDYFNLHINLSDLYKEWRETTNSNVDNIGNSRLNTIMDHLIGVRVLRQDPYQTLMCFILSSNNNIPRINLLVDRLEKGYGSFLCDVVSAEDKNTVKYKFYTFPNHSQLKELDEQTYRDLGLGYRAKFFVSTIAKLSTLPPSYLTDLRLLIKADLSAYELSQISYITGENWDPKNGRKTISLKLCEFMGVGRKVADCISLFSMDTHNCIPVDTHVWKIGLREFGESSGLGPTPESLSFKKYESLGEYPRYQVYNHTNSLNVKISICQHLISDSLPHPPFL